MLHVSLLGIPVNHVLLVFRTEQKQKAENTARITALLCNLLGWIQTLGWKPGEQIQH